jgi:hypothetical protein
MDPLKVGADKCKLDGGEDAEARNPNIGVGVRATEVRMQACV